MPRVSGFEMLDILRNTEGLKHVKVIMLTALGQAEDKTRSDSLGAHMGHKRAGQGQYLLH